MAEVVVERISAMPRVRQRHLIHIARKLQITERLQWERRAYLSDEKPRPLLDFWITFLHTQIIL